MDSWMHGVLKKIEDRLDGEIYEENEYIEN